MPGSAKIKDEKWKLEEENMEEETGGGNPVRWKQEVVQ
jgi:hypothetical protein